MNTILPSPTQELPTTRPCINCLSHRLPPTPTQTLAFSTLRWLHREVPFLWLANDITHLLDMVEQREVPFLRLAYDIAYCNTLDSLGLLRHPRRVPPVPPRLRLRPQLTAFCVGHKYESTSPKASSGTRSTAGTSTVMPSLCVAICDLRICV